MVEFYQTMSAIGNEKRNPFVGFDKPDVETAEKVIISRVYSLGARNPRQSPAAVPARRHFPPPRSPMSRGRSEQHAAKFGGGPGELTEDPLRVNRRFVIACRQFIEWQLNLLGRHRWRGQKRGHKARNEDTGRIGEC